MKRVVIIGGGFTGSRAAIILEKQFKVTLIDEKEYFEFTPSVLRLIAEPQYFKKIRVRHKDYLKKSDIIKGKVIEIDKKRVKTSNKSINYDYLIIASGSHYGIDVLGDKFCCAGDGENILKAQKKLNQAKNIIIVGGGLVGVELAGEIITTKKINLVHAKDRILERNHRKTTKIAENFLKKNKVDIIYNSRVMLNNTRKILTDKNQELKGDIVFICTGIRPNYDFMKKNLSEHLSKRNSIMINENLQLKGIKNIFSGGDVNDIKEEKTAQAAIEQGRIIAHNIIRLEKNLPLKKYECKKRPLIISLGKYNSIFEYKSFVFSGFIAAFLKYLVEKKSLFPYTIRKYL